MQNHDEDKKGSGLLPHRSVLYFVQRGLEERGSFAPANAKGDPFANMERGAFFTGHKHIDRCICGDDVQDLRKCAVDRSGGPIYCKTCGTRFEG